jgi:PTH1 family peptidyl-tRNA hydrolase
MYIIVGLGNPGLQYQNSRHNAGFWVLDEIARRCSIDVKKHAHKAVIGEGFYQGEKILLCKPQTYMNLSGEAVQSLMQYYKIPIEHLLVLYDDVDLSVGDLRIRKSGSAGTHNGMRSILACLQDEQDFPRVRIGIGRQAEGRDLANYVLGKPEKEDKERIDEAIANAAEAALLIVSGELNQAQERFNKKPKKKKAEQEIQNEPGASSGVDAEKLPPE